MKMAATSAQNINSNFFNYICNCVEQEYPVPHNLFFYKRRFFMNKKKFVAMGAVLGSLMLTQGVFAAGISVMPSQNALSVQSGEAVNKVDAVPAYMY